MLEERKCQNVPQQSNDRFTYDRIDGDTVAEVLSPKSCAKQALIYTSIDITSTVTRCFYLEFPSFFTSLR
jgi:hypothetical protein